jgi:hypothetical protein
VSSAGRRALLAIGVMALVVACQEAPRPQPRVVPLLDLLGQAREAMGRGDYDTSARLLRQVVAGSPDNLEAHFRLAVSASWLDLTDEAEGQFEWVVAHGAPDSAEVKAARDWLRAWRAQAEAVPAPESAPTRPDRSTLSGRVLWAKDGSVGPQPYLRLFLKGLKGTPIEDEFHRFQTDEQGMFRIADLSPGEYSLTNRVAGPPIWRLKVTLKAGEDLQLDLTPENSVKARDDFPDSR